MNLNEDCEFAKTILSFWPLILGQGHSKSNSIGAWITSNHSTEFHKDIISSFLLIILLIDKQIDTGE